MGVFIIILKVFKILGLLGVLTPYIIKMGYRPGQIDSSQALRWLSQINVLQGLVLFALAEITLTIISMT